MSEATTSNPLAEVPPADGAGPSKNALKKKAKEEEKARKAEERKRKEEEARAAKAEADSVVCL
jgi:aspartyl-tRNA synthetase